MLSKIKETKIHRKQKRCQAIIFKETGIPFSAAPTEFIAICNAGLSTGLQDSTLLAETLKYGDVENLIMIPNKSYCFLKCSDIKSSQNIYDKMHGQTTLGQNDSVLYLSFFVNAPDVKNEWSEKLPPGLILIENFIDETEEEILLKAINVNSIIENGLKHRNVKHFGYEFLYETNQVDHTKPIDRKIPTECSILWSRMKTLQLQSKFEWYDEPDQLTVNQYCSGQGIPPHVDTHSAFLDPIISLSLEGEYVMEFRKNDEHISVRLPRRSILIMSGESRFDWTHGITPRHMDVVPGTNGGLTVNQRGNRTSLTFRKLRRADCCCSFPRLCDSRRKNNNVDEHLLKDFAAKLEMTNVHSVYDEIADHFSETRHSPWPQVSEFLNSFEPGSILVDIGCGNGKYLDINKNILMIGCDRSKGLLDLCAKRKFNVFKCDCLQVPLRDNSVNGCISIAVIHHLATKERRLQAINEMVRLLQIGGRALIYVWAKNQQADSKKSSYLRQNKTLNKHKNTEDELRMTKTPTEYSKLEIALPIHTNRTTFQQQDILVPWKLKNSMSSNEQVDVKDGQTFLRYYHVFEEFELEKLCKEIESIQLMKSYYDQGNWCVIFEKIK